ncbi:hypothetical protein [Nonomuraea maritima]|uniref:hypothetical protein n=1 Tax=Nonomuraea maritima TaxID=683260 RepID=UPI00372181FF
MPPHLMTVSGVEVTPLCDAVGPMGAAILRPLPELFAGSGLADDEPWTLHFHCYQVRPQCSGLQAGGEADPPA